MSIAAYLKRLPSNTGFILALALVVGLVFGAGASWTKPTVTPLLGLVMTLSVMGISSEVFRRFRSLLAPIIISIFLNYVVLSGTFIGLSYLLVQDNDLWTGFVLCGAVPPAVAVIPYTYHLGGNTTFSLVGVAVSYLAALLVTPLISVAFLGNNFIQLGRLLITLAELIIAPILVSQILRRVGVASKLEKFRGQIINWSFFLVVYTIIGLNREAFLGQPDILLRLSVVAFVCTFVLGYVISSVSKLLGVKKADRVSLMLLGTRKNYGLAGAIALTFFSPRVAMASGVATAFNILHFIWLSLWVKKSS